MIENLDATVSSRNSTTPPTSAAIASQVRTELTTELGRIDAAISSRNATTPPTAEAIADAVCDEALSGHTIAGSLAKKIADDPTAAQVASQVRTELTTELGRLDVAVSTRNATTPPSVGAIADAVCDEALVGHGTAGSVGAALTAAGSAGDPWATTKSVLESYDPETAAGLVLKLDVGEAEDPVIVIPSPPVDVTLCRVYGYLETVEGKPAANVTITFELLAPDPTASNKLVSGRKISVTTNVDGRIVNSDGDLWIDLQRNDHITPSGSSYVVTSKDLKMSRTPISLTTDTFDLRDLVVA